MILCSVNGTPWSLWREHLLKPTYVLLTLTQPRIDAKIIYDFMLHFLRDTQRRPIFTYLCLDLFCLHFVYSVRRVQTCTWLIQAKTRDIFFNPHPQKIIILQKNIFFKCKNLIFFFCDQNKIRYRLRIISNLNISNFLFFTIFRHNTPKNPKMNQVRYNIVIIY